MKTINQLSVIACSIIIGVVAAGCLGMPPVEAFNRNELQASLSHVPNSPLRPETLYIEFQMSQATNVTEGNTLFFTVNHDMGQMGRDLSLTVGSAMLERAVFAGVTLDPARKSSAGFQIVGRCTEARMHNRLEGGNVDAVMSFEVAMYKTGSSQPEWSQTFTAKAMNLQITVFDSLRVQIARQVLEKSQAYFGLAATAERK